MSGGPPGAYKTQDGPPRNAESGKIYHLGPQNMQSELSKDLPEEHAASHLAAIIEASDNAIISKTLDGYILT